MTEYNIIEKMRLEAAGVDVPSQHFVHPEHVDLLSTEDSSHGIVAHDLTLVGRILKLMTMNILP
jgi:hypothetical protein